MSIRDDFFTAQAQASLWDVAVSIKRGNPLPLDANSVFKAYGNEDGIENVYTGSLLEYAQTNAVAYPGQICAVVGENETTLYYLDQNLDVQPIKDLEAAERIAALEEAIAQIKHPEYTIKKATTPTDGSLATYELQKDGISVAEKIEVVKDERLKNISGDLKDYIDEAIGKAEVAAMEFMGTIRELPKLKLENKGHFYKVMEDIEVTNAVYDTSKSKTFSTSNKVVTFDEFWREENSGEDANISYRVIPIISCGKRVKVEIMVSTAMGPDWTYGEPFAYENYYDYGSSMEVGKKASLRVTLLDELEEGETLDCTFEKYIEATVSPAETTIIKTGDSVVWNGYVWYVIPSGDDLDNTWRPVTIEDVALDQKTELKIAAGENVDIAYNEEDNVFTISSTDTNTEYQGKDAITIREPEASEGDKQVVELLLATGDKAGNVELTQDENGLKAQADITVDSVIPAISKVKEANTELVLQKITASGLTVTQTPIEMVTAGILKDTGLIDPTKVYSEKMKWEKAGDGIAQADNEQTTLQNVLKIATVTTETSTDEEGKTITTLTGGYAGLLTPEEKFKIQQLVIDADGSVGISGTISADNVTGLTDKIVTVVTEDLTIARGAQVNKLEGLKLPGATNAMTINSDKIIELPAFTAGAFGLIKGAQDVDGKVVANKIYAGEDGVGEVKSISTDSFVNGEKELILYGGKANLNG